MKKFVFKSMILLTLFGLVGCSNESLVEDSNISNNNGILERISITGEDFQFDEETRSTVNITESGASFLWDEDDVVGIFPNKGDQVSFAMDGGSGTQTATFSGGGWALKSSATYAAYYPHVYENRDMTKIPVSYVAQTQNGNNNTDHIGAYDFMAASVTTPSNGAVAFDMQHLGCLVQLNITIPEPSTLTKITLNSSINLTETGTIDLSVGTPSITAKTQSNVMEIGLTNVTTTEENEKVTIYFMMAPVDLTSSELIAKINFNDGTTHETDFAGKKLEAGKAYALEEVDRRLYSYKTVAIAPSQDSNGTYLIRSASNLKWFQNNCKYIYGQTYDKANYKLLTDIVFESSYSNGWKSVGWFYGNFDGGNHVIENITFYSNNDNARWGFFSEICGGTVKNLVFKNPKIYQRSDNDSYSVHSGVLAAKASGNIINCGVIGGNIDVRATSKAHATGGGLIGVLYGFTTKVLGCYVVDTTISGGNTGNIARVGGLIGCLGNPTSFTELQVSVISCYTDNVTVSGGERYVGAFIGSTYWCSTDSEPSYITSCYYDGSGSPIGETRSNNTITTSNFEALTDANFTTAISSMNSNLTDCDYIFDTDGKFIKNE